MTSIEEYKHLAELGRYARFIHTNLHLHTPATPWDWNSFDGQTKKAGILTPEEYFGKLNETSLELVAITDHNTVSWCEPLMRMAQEGRKNGTCKLHILPGVEITSYEGPHIIGIFEEDIDLIPKIHHMLIRLGLSGEGKEDDRVSKSLSNKFTLIDIIVEIVDVLGGVVIAPHVHTHDGIWGNQDFRGRYDVLTNDKLNILAAPSNHIKRVVDNNGKSRLLYKNMDSEQYKKSYGFINISDCHRINDFEENTTWVKMGEPTLEGIKQIVYEPELRVCHNLIESDKDVEFPCEFHFSEPEVISYPHIIGMSISGGNLDGQLISFSPHQNSIIGKNYAGKSAVLDLLRFGLDSLPHPSGDGHAQTISRVCGILQEGGKVNIYLVGEDDRVYGVSRVLSWSTERKVQTIEGRPTISMLIDEEFVKESDISVQEKIQLEVYPQGQVVKIKDNAKEQIQIIDSLGKIRDERIQLEEPELDGEYTILGNLHSNGRRIIQYRDQIEALEGEIQGKEELELDITNLEKLFEEGHVDELKSWANLKGAVDGYTKTLKELRDLSKDVKNNYLIDDIDVQEAGLEVDNQDFNFAKASPQEYEEFASHIHSNSLRYYVNQADECLELIESHIGFLEEINLQGESRYTQILEGLQDVNEDEKVDYHNVIIERIGDKQKKLALIITREGDLAEAQKDLLEELAKRNNLLEEFQNLLTRISEKRQEIVDFINDSSTPNVKSELEKFGDRKNYEELLADISSNLTSSEIKIQSKKTQLAKITDEILPDQLVEIIRGNDANKLIEAAGVTDNTARIIMSMSESDIQRLETCVVYDTFRVLYQKEGEDTFTPIDAGLSGGEQALALISVAMIPKAFPLVIDQPEDELGPSLITNELVEQIRNVKNSRQLIFVTHVANIPVLGDSEQIAYIKQSIEDGEKSSSIECNGSLEHKPIIEKLLELDGGEIAFQKRKERYSTVMKDG